MKLIMLFLCFLVSQNYLWIAPFNNGFEGIPLEYSEKLKDKKVVLIGEAHFNSANPEIFYNYLIKLNKDFEFTEILLELGYSDGYLMTKYLECGEDSLIHDNIFYKSKNYRDMFKKIYEYNKVLQKERKLHFIGIDFERQKSAIHAILLLINDLNLSSSLEIEIAALKEIYMKSTAWNLEDSTIDLLNQLHNKIISIDYKIDKSSLSYKDLMMILENNASSKRMTDRNYDMMLNFKKIYTPSKKYFGQFGSIHVRLEKNFTFAKRVISNMEGISIENLEVIPIGYYKAEVLHGKGSGLATGGGFNFLAKLDGKPSEFSKNIGIDLNPGVYVLDLSIAPKKYSKRLNKMYNYMLYVNKAKAVEWGK